MVFLEAGPMFNQAEKDFNLQITKVLEQKGYQVFIAREYVQLIYCRFPRYGYARRSCAKFLRG
jgi:hypothetical protein